MSALVIIALVAILIGWALSCYFVVYSWTVIGLNDGDDVNLNLASKYLGYASLSSWVLFLIAIGLFLLAIILLIILLIFGSEFVIPISIQVTRNFFHNLTQSFSKEGNVSTSFTIVLWVLLVLSIILTFITGLYTGLAAYYINKGVYDESSANSIQKALKYCYYTSFISIIILVIIFFVIVSKIYFGIKSRKNEKEKETVVLKEE